MKTGIIGTVISLMGLQAFGLTLRSDLTSIDQIAEIRNHLNLVGFQIQTPSSILGIQQVGKDSYRVVAVNSRGPGKTVEVVDVTSEFSKSELPAIVEKTKAAIRDSDYGKSGMKPAFNLTSSMTSFAALGAQGGVVLPLGAVAASWALDVLTSVIPIQPIIWKFYDLKGKKERNQLAERMALESNNILRVDAEEFFQVKSALTSVRPAGNSIERICREFYKGI